MDERLRSSAGSIGVEVVVAPLASDVLHFGTDDVVLKVVGETQF